MARDHPLAVLLLTLAACGGEAGLELPAVDFGQVPVGGAARRQVTLPPGATRAITDADQITLDRAPDEATLTVQWAPRQLQPLTAELRFVDEARRVLARAEVLGEARAPRVEVWPPTLRLSPSAPGARSTASLWVRPETDVEVRAASDSLWSGCPHPGACLDLPVPRAAAGLPAQLEVSLPDGAPPPGPLALSLCDDPRCRVEVPVAAAQARGDLECTPARIELPAAAVGFPRDITVRCEGAPWSATVQHPEISLTEVSESEVTVRWTPTDAGPISGRLSLGPGHPPLIIEGYAVNAPPCDLRLEPEVLRFGLAPFGQSTQAELQVVNRGPEPCLLGGVEGVPPGVFEADAQPPLWLAPYASHSRNLTFAPRAVGPLDGRVRVHAPADSGAVEAELFGAGVAPSLEVDPSHLDFGPQGQCATQTKAIRVSNRGGASGFVELIEIEGAPPQLLAASGRPPIEVAPGATLQIPLRLTRPPLGALSASAALVLSGPTGPSRAEVLITGEGTPQPIVEDHFEQLRLPRVDLLLVVDEGPGLALEQDYLREGLSRLAATAALNADMRVAVIGDSLDDPRTAGRFRPVHDPAAQVLWTETSTRFAQDVGDLVAQVGTGTGTVGQGLEAALQALANNPSFMRPDAELSVLVFTTRDDASPSTVEQMQVRFRFEPRGAPSLRTHMSVIGGRPPEGCTDGALTAAPSLRYAEIAAFTGGLVQDICDREWVERLPALRSPFGLKSRFILRRRARPASIEVFVNDSRVASRTEAGVGNWTYDDSTQSVNFSHAATPSHGARILIRYQTQCAD